MTKRTLLAILLVIATLLSWAQNEARIEHVPDIPQETAHVLPDAAATTTTLVTRVIDGDTIEIAGGERVRYIGIDTPEQAQGASTPECFADEAQKRNEELVLGRHITLVRDVRDRDTYHRLLRYVFVDGTFVNETLVREGFARAVSYPPDTAHQALFQNAERAARAATSGLWRSCAS